MDFSLKNVDVDGNTFRMQCWDGLEFRSPFSKRMFFLESLIVVLVIDLAGKYHEMP